MQFDDYCQKYKTDKSSKNHNFCAFYDKNIDIKGVSSILEVGVKKGSSLKAWASYAPDATVVGLDIKPCEGCLEGFDNASVQWTDQNSKKALADSIGDRNFDLIIDDGGHTMQQQQNTLDVYWDHVNPGGSFIMEDLHTSHKPKFYTHGYRKTAELLTDAEFSLPGLEKVECNFEFDDWHSNDHMTCILHKAAKKES